jgi:hypothetical protein
VTSAAAPSRPLPEADRRRLASALRQCRTQTGPAQQARCRHDACAEADAWGRTKSCPAAADATGPTLRAAAR